MNKTNWWKILFDQNYLDLYFAELTSERTSREVDFIVEAFGLKTSDKILDLACGHGRHSIELAKRGFSVIGLDYSELFLKKAEVDAKLAGVKVKFLKGDMRNLPFHDEFDVVLMLFTAFGYFDDTGNNLTLSQIAKALKPNGRFLLDVRRGEAVIVRFNKAGKKEENTGLLKMPELFKAGELEINGAEWFDPRKQQVHNHREWMDSKGIKKESDFYLKVYTLDQHKKMLQRAGLKFEKVWGDFEGNLPNSTNSRAIILSQKSWGNRHTDV